MNSLADNLNAQDRDKYPVDGIQFDHGNDGPALEPNWMMWDTMGGAMGPQNDDPVPQGYMRDRWGMMKRIAKGRTPVLGRRFNFCNE